MPSSSKVSGAREWWLNGNTSGWAGLPRRPRARALGCRQTQEEPCPPHSPEPPEPRGGCVLGVMGQHMLCGLAAARTLRCRHGDAVGPSSPRRRFWDKGQTPSQHLQLHRDPPPTLELLPRPPSLPPAGLRPELSPLLSRPLGPGEQSPVSSRTAVPEVVGSSPLLSRPCRVLRTV